MHVGSCEQTPAYTKRLPALHASCAESHDGVMRTISCEYCGQPVNIEIEDEGPEMLVVAVTEHAPGRFAIYGGTSHWLLHRCDLEPAEIDLRDATVTRFENVETITPA